MKKLLIFDFDGVLEDTFELSYTLFKKQLPDLAREEYRTWFDGNLYAHLKEQNIQLDMHTYYAGYAEALSLVNMRPEWSSILKKLHSAFSLAAVSSSPGEAIGEYLSRNTVRNYFEEVWGYEKNASKVEKIQLLTESHHLSPQNCWFITDTLGDIRESKKAGVPCIAVTWGFHSRGHLEQGSPNATVETPQQLLEFLLAEGRK